MAESSKPTDHWKLAVSVVAVVISIIFGIYSARGDTTDRISSLDGRMSAAEARIEDIRHRSVQDQARLYATLDAMRQDVQRLSDRIDKMLEKGNQ